jgi:hypothetical protein
VFLDGTLIATDRVAADGPYYSQKHKKHKKHGMNVRVVLRTSLLRRWTHSVGRRTSPAETPQ